MKGAYHRRYMSAVLVDSRRVGADPRRRRRRCGLDHRPSIGADSGVGGVVVRGVRTVCHGRLSPSFAHRTYRPAAAVRWAMLAFGAATFQNSALSWSADHRAHHADTDGSGDPHPVTRGAWFAHIGWLFRRRQASADVTLPSDLWAVRSIRLQHRYYPAVALGVGLVLPAVIAAQWGDPWGGLLVAGFLRAAVMLQATFCVNSLAHLVGTRRYDAALLGAGQRAHRPHHLRRGISQLPSPIPLRLPQQSSLVALRPEQMADLDARQHRNGQRVANRLGRHHRQGRHVGARRGLTGPVACVVDRHASAGAMAKPLDEVGPVPICRRCTRSRRRPAPPLAERGGSTIDWRSSFWPRRGRAEGGGREHLDTPRYGGEVARSCALSTFGSAARVGVAVATWHGARCGGGWRTVFLPGPAARRSDRPGGSTMRVRTLLSIERRGARSWSRSETGFACRR